MVFSLEPWSLGDEKAWGYEDYSVQFNVDSGYRKPRPQLHLLGRKPFGSFGDYLFLPGVWVMVDIHSWGCWTESIEPSPMP